MATTRARRGVTSPVVVADGSRSVYATRNALDAGADRDGIVFNRSELGCLVAAFLDTIVWTSGETVAVAAAGLDSPASTGRSDAVPKTC